MRFIPAVHGRIAIARKLPFAGRWSFAPSNPGDANARGSTQKHKAAAR